MQRRTIRGGRSLATPSSSSGGVPSTSLFSPSLPIAHLPRAPVSPPSIVTTTTVFGTNASSSTPHDASQRIFPDVHYQSRFPQALQVNGSPNADGDGDAYVHAGMVRKRTHTSGEQEQRVNVSHRVPQDDMELDADRPLKKRRSIGGAILETALDTVIFTGAVAYTAYRLWRGNTTEEANEDKSPERDTDAMEEGQEMKAAAVAPDTPSSPKKTPGPAYRIHMSRSRPSSRPSSARKLKAHYVKPKKTALGNKEPEDDEDQVFARFQEKLSNMINEGKAALRSKVDVWDIKEGEVGEDDQQPQTPHENIQYEPVKPSSSKNTPTFTFSQPPPRNPFVQHPNPFTQSPSIHKTSLEGSRSPFQQSNSQRQQQQQQQPAFNYSHSSFQPSSNSTFQSSSHPSFQPSHTSLQPSFQFNHPQSNAYSPSFEPPSFNSPFTFGSSIETSPFRGGFVEPPLHPTPTTNTSRIPKWTFSPSISAQRLPTPPSRRPSSGLSTSRLGLGLSPPQSPEEADSPSKRNRMQSQSNDSRRPMSDRTHSMPGEWGAGWR